VFLLLVVTLIFIFQGPVIPPNIVHIFLLIVPYTLQTFSVFLLATALMLRFRVPFEYAAPGMLIAASNFFELAVALAITLYGPASGATLATVVGVLVEVPTMLFLVWVCKRLRWCFEARSTGLAVPPSASSSQEEPAGSACEAPVQAEEAPASGAGEAGNP